MLGTRDLIARARPTTECAQCGKLVRRPEWSEYSREREVRHLWACAACGYTFETHVKFADPKVEQKAA